MTVLKVYWVGVSSKKFASAKDRRYISTNYEKCFILRENKLNVRNFQKKYGIETAKHGIETILLNRTPFL